MSNFREKRILDRVSSGEKALIANQFEMIFDQFLPHKNPRRFLDYLLFVYADINFEHKRVLDIGGGCGLHSFFAVFAGAQTATVLEPAGAGSDNDIYLLFDSIQKATSTPRVGLTTSTFQEFSAPEETFDIIILHDSVNHLDEAACSALPSSRQAVATYQSVFNKLNSLLAPQGKLVVCDCSRLNFFNLIGMANPFDPSIEWYKHNRPHVWAQLLESSGFSLSSLKWTPPGRTGAFGRRFLANSMAAFFFTSHFCLYADKGDRSSH